MAVEGIIEKNEYHRIFMVLKETENMTDEEYRTAVEEEFKRLDQMIHQKAKKNLTMMSQEFDIIVVTVEKSLLRMSYENQNLHARNIDTKLRVAIYAMTEFAYGETCSLPDD